MNPVRRRKFCFILFVLLILSIFAALVLYALRQNINLFYSPTQIAQGGVQENRLIRLGGMVKKGSVHRAQDSLVVHFVLTDFTHSVEVHYQGILPDLFKEGQGIVTSGKLKEGVFIAEEVLAKHDENYMPAPVKAMLAQKRGHDAA